MADRPTPNRYQVPWVAMVGALIVVVGLVSVGRIWRVVTNADSGTATPAVDYQGWVRSARQDGRLQTWAPPRLPAGWRATSAEYTPGTAPEWRLGVLTANQQYVGIDESLAPLAELIQQNLSSGAKRTGMTSIGGHRWVVWTDARGDYVVTRTFTAPKGGVSENLLVGGSATPAQIRSYVAGLRRDG